MHSLRPLDAVDRASVQPLLAERDLEPRDLGIEAVRRRGEQQRRSRRHDRDDQAVHPPRVGGAEPVSSLSSRKSGRELFPSAAPRTLSTHVRGDRISRRPRRAGAGVQEPAHGQDRCLDRRARPLARPAQPGRDRRPRLAQRALGHGHGDLVRLHRPRLPLPGPADRPDRPRLVRDPALRISARRDLHAGARVVRGRRRAEQLPAREHRDVRDAAHVRRGRARLHVPGRARRLRRPEDLLLHHRDADLHLPVLGRGRLLRVPIRKRARRDHEPPRAHARHHLRRGLPARPARADLLGLGQEDVGAGKEGRGHPRRPRART